jgi:hypothetical protein
MSIYFMKNYCFKKWMRVFWVLGFWGILFDVSLAKATFECGKYELRGILRQGEIVNQETQWVYKINEGTMSEKTFVFKSFKEFKKVSSFLNQPTVLRATLLDPMDATDGKIDQVYFVKMRMIHPLGHGLDTGLELVDHRRCIFP